MLGGPAHDVIPRPGLAARLTSSRAGLAVAPAGFGKSSLLAEAALSLDQVTVRVVPAGATDDKELAGLVARGMRRVGLLDLAEAAGAYVTDRIAGGGPERLVQLLRQRNAGLTIVVDDLHLVDEMGQGWLAEIVLDIPAGCRVLAGGRRIGRALTRAVGEVGGATLGPDELRFDRNEVAKVVAPVIGGDVGDEILDAIERSTEGWPAAVVVVAARLAAGGSPLAATPGVRLLDDLVAAQLRDADETARTLVARLALLPLLSESVAEAVGGPGALARAIDVGLPIRRRLDGWYELPDAVREVLIGKAHLAAPVARTIARLYAAGGELAQGAELLHRRGDHLGVVDLLTAQRWTDLAGIGLPTLGALLDAAPDSVLAPHLGLLVRAALAGEQHAPELRPRWLERADRLAPPTGPMRRAVDAERARESARDGDLDEAVSAATAVLEAVAPQEELTRGRALLTRGLARLVQANGAADAATVADLEAAAALFGITGERRWEATALQALGFGVHVYRGSFERAEECLRSAVTLLAAPDLTRGMCLTYLAEAQIYGDRLADAEASLREAAAIGRRLAREDLIAYAAWTSAELATYRRDRASAEAAMAEAARNPGGWFDRLPGIDFLAGCADMRIRLGTIDGDFASALEALEAAEARAEGTGYLLTTRLARARYEVAVGTPDAATRALDELEPLGIDRDRWLYLLLRAVCAERRREPAASAALLARAKRAVVDLGDPERMTRREPGLLAMLGRAPLLRDGGLRISVLGGFAVNAGTTDVSPPSGRPATLVKLLALRTVLTIDEAVDVLWPEADEATGRARIRNLLNRIRTSSGELVIRRDTALTLAPGVEVDLQRFERATTLALEAPPEQRVGAARQALAHHPGGLLLPGDLYEDWAAAPRERQHRRQLALLDLLADDAVVRGDLDEAVQLLDLAIAAEPFELARYLVAARALIAQGRRASAIELSARAGVVADELGIALPPGFDTLTAHPPASA